ncbi:HSF-type DNA-binding-domain-containing protein, partial [Gaertneriomyces semiglobifer]
MCSLFSKQFVRKLRNMVADRQYQHLISWNYSGTSFIVCNVLQFSREVLPKHFKHNNFSSFVRQLNMYGFHKVNKSPRGSRTLAENQVWEFSHAKFLRDRPHLCDEIKRKSVETETFRKEASDIYAQLQVIHVNQADIMQQLQQMQERFGDMAKEMSESRRRQIIHERMMKNMMDFMKEQF